MNVSLLYSTRPRHILRRAFDDGHVVPVAIVLREVAKATLGVPEQIFAPTVLHARDGDAAHLKPDRLPAILRRWCPWCQAEWPARCVRFAAGVAEDGEVWIARVENGGARRTGNGLRERSGSKLDRRPALRTVESFDVRRARAAGERIVAQVREMQVVVRDILADEEDWRRLAEVYSGKPIVVPLRSMNSTRSLFQYSNGSSPSTPEYSAA